MHWMTVAARVGPYVGVALLVGAIAWNVQGDRKDAELERLKASQAQALAAAHAQARATERELMSKADQLRREKDAQIQTIHGRLAAALGELRERPARGEPLPGVAATCPAATGAELSGPDAEFLARESARADELRAALGACYAQYEQVRQRLSN